MEFIIAIPIVIVCLLGVVSIINVFMVRGLNRNQENINHKNEIEMLKNLHKNEIEKLQSQVNLLSEAIIEKEKI